MIFFEAIFATQLTVGELLLNKATCLCAMSSATPSRQSHNRSNPAFELCKWDAAVHSCCPPNPLVQDGKQGRLFWFLKPNGFGDPIELEPKETFGGVVFAFALPQLFE